MGELRYDDPCGIARAMGVIGDRWAVLVVRELLFGPRRFAQLKAGLGGISANVLSQRLRDLEASGVVRRSVVEIAGVTVYELTDRGRALERVLLELGRWGSREQITSQRELSVSALMFALETAFDPSVARDAVYLLRIDGESWTVTVDGATIGIRRGGEPDSDVVFDSDVTTLRALAFGRVSLSDAEAGGRLRVSGARRPASRFGRLFPLPVSGSGDTDRLSGSRATASRARGRTRPG
ncbi:MAG TPA: winged helix-turn-helix transcriptional regulator [Jatrophihabitans sp.]